jgi:ankyrin repeat protein
MKEELQNMNLSDLRFVCQELGISCPKTKKGIVKKLLQPLSKKYRMNNKIKKKIPSLTKLSLKKIKLNPTSIEYIKNNYPETIVEMILNRQDKNGETPLMKASFDGNTEMVKLLIENGSDVNHIANKGKSKSKISALILATFKGNIEIVTLLLNAGADVNHTDSRNMTALYNAAANNYKDIVELLIKKGADVNVQENRYKHSALMFAAARNYREIVTLLLNAGADVNAKDIYGAPAKLYLGLPADVILNMGQIGKFKNEEVLRNSLNELLGRY